MDKAYPIAYNHGPSALRLAMGLPTAAYCCWNGAAAVNAHIFLPPPPPPPPPPASSTSTNSSCDASAAGAPGFTKHGRLDGDRSSSSEESPGASSFPQLRFRRSLPGECDASECSLLCDDMQRLGYGRVLIDPWVRLSYMPYHDRGLHHEWLHGAPMVTWGELAAVGAAGREGKDAAPMDVGYNKRTPQQVGGGMGLMVGHTLLSVKVKWGSWLLGRRRGRHGRAAVLMVALRMVLVWAAIGGPATGGGAVMSMKVGRARHRWVLATGGCCYELLS